MYSLKTQKTILDPQTVIKRLELILEDVISPETDLLLLDEIQDCPAAYESLKFFKEDFPQLDIIATGSYLKLFIENQDKIKRHPVGSVREVLLHPLTFEEFLLNANEPLYKEFVKISVAQDTKIDEIVHKKLCEYMRYYFFAGGLPDAVKLFLNSFKTSLVKAANETRSKQNDLISQYRNDLLKYANSPDIPKIRKIFDNIALQLSQYQEDTVGRFSFKEVSGKQGYKTLKSAFDYLSYSGLIIKSFIVNHPKHPLRIETKKENRNTFKVFIFDIGLLQAMLDIPFRNIIEEELGAYKGFIAESFVAQELYSSLDSDLFSFRNRPSSASAEIEFLISSGTEIIPIEVKSSHKHTRSKSLSVYVKNYTPEIAYKLTPNNITQTQQHTVLPIYLARKIVPS